MQPEVDAEDVLAQPSEFCRLLDDLRTREFEVSLDELHQLQRASTFGQWELVRNPAFQEFHIRTQLGRVATIQIANGKLTGKAIPPEQHEINGRFLVLLKNNADWLIRASRFAIRQGFKP